MAGKSRQQLGSLEGHRIFKLLVWSLRPERALHDAFSIPIRGRPRVSASVRLEAVIGLLVFRFRVSDAWLYSLSTLFWDRYYAKHIQGFNVYIITCFVQNPLQIPLMYGVLNLIILVFFVNSDNSLSNLNSQSTDVTSTTRDVSWIIIHSTFTKSRIPEQTQLALSINMQICESVPCVICLMIECGTSRLN